MKLVSIPANPAPSGAAVGAIETPDGVTLRYARFAPPPGRKGTVCLFQGRAEFIEKYFEVVHDLRSRGFAVATIDFRGQGLSQRAVRDSRKGHARRFSDYLIDLETFVKQVVLPDCPPPFFALGQGMGATVLIESAARGHRWFDRMVLASPMIGLAQRPLFGAGPTFARSLRLLGFGRLAVPGGSRHAAAAEPFADNPLTSDPIRYARTAAVIEAEPALTVGAPTVAWTDAAFRTMTAMQRPQYPARLRQPMLLIAGGHDTMISTAAIERFGFNLRAGSHLVIPGALHDLMMEQEQLRKLFWAAFDAFVPGTPLYG
ncbi:alpha/beta hydrolase [Rhodoplanes elegans]|uniref:Alpha/beta hydrolase n=1 Tax=Rhodoplanes elegans TaxID=29408 RepID=A0A327JTE3_9BRAD|nr:alpha/beta hydrolase [Rhodoplanes elegans]MBK5957353.1 alpha/beta hydrolase [Rhodoplanes elegans]RAI28723.1 alpha/beta hydrolase [Rhodoplanes elegans]